MSPELPVGFQRRRPGREDAEAIFGVIDRHNTPLAGSPDVTVTEVRDELSEPGFDLTSDAWLVGDTDGADVAPPWACTGTSACGRCWPSTSGRPGPRRSHEATRVVWLDPPVGLVPHIVRPTSPAARVSEYRVRYHAGNASSTASEGAVAVLPGAQQTGAAA